MNIIGNGVDIVENKRINKLIDNKKFIKRVFTNKEIKFSKNINFRPRADMKAKFAKINDFRPRAYIKIKIKKKIYMKIQQLNKQHIII